MNSDWAARLDIADDFFLTAHDVTGRPLLPPRLLGIGLASAMLAELLAIGRITVRDGALAVIDRRPPGDALARLVLDQLVDQPYHQRVRDWIAYLATSAETSVGQRLARAGQVRRRQRRRIVRTTVVYEPVDMNTAGWPAARLHHRLSLRSTDLPQADVVLAGLVVATGLDQHILWDLDTSQRRHLTELLSCLPPPLRELVALCETAVGEAVLSHRI